MRDKIKEIKEVKFMKKGVKATYITASLICLSSLLLYLFYAVFDVGLNLYNDNVLDYYINIDIEGSLIGSIGTIMLFLVGVFNLSAVNRLRNHRIFQTVSTAVLTAVSYCLTLASFNMHLSPLIEKYERYGHYLSMDELEIAIPAFVVTLIIITTLFYLPAIYLCFMTYYVHKIEKQEAYNDGYKPKVGIVSVLLDVVTIIIGVLVSVFSDVINTDQLNKDVVHELVEHLGVFFLIFGAGLLLTDAIITIVVLIDRKENVSQPVAQPLQYDVPQTQPVTQTTTFVPVTPTPAVQSTNSFCENCGAKVEESYAFCLKCGNKIQK